MSNDQKAVVFLGVPEIARAVFGNADSASQNRIRRMTQRRELPVTTISGQHAMTQAALDAWARGQTKRCLAALKPELIRDFKTFDALAKPRRGRPPKNGKPKLTVVGADR